MNDLGQFDDGKTTYAWQHLIISFIQNIGRIRPGIACGRIHTKKEAEVAQVVEAIEECGNSVI